MAYEIPGLSFSLVAAADLTTHQFKFVHLDATGKAVLASAGGAAIGVLQNKPNTGQTGTIVSSGITKVVAGGIVTAGAAVKSDSTGRAIAQGGTDTLLGYAMVGAAGAGVVIPVLMAVTGKGVSGITGSVVSIPFKYAKLANGDFLTTWTPGFAGTIIKAAVAVTDPVTTGSKAATLNLEIGATNLTGGVISLTSANSTPLGAVIASTAITGGNAFSDTDTISVEVSGVTAFSEGEGVLLITLA